jgi:hypothetical protein
MEKLSAVNIEHRSDGRSFDAVATLVVPRARLAFLILFFCLYSFEKLPSRFLVA